MVLAMMCDPRVKHLLTSGHQQLVSLRIVPNMYRLIALGRRIAVVGNQRGAFAILLCLGAKGTTLFQELL